MRGDALLLGYGMHERGQKTDELLSHLGDDVGLSIHGFQVPAIERPIKHGRVLI